ncbi:zinc ribbon domain-containing protein [Halapricum desulfuricans]|uniref:zinc ribbon domain-containing protein n=1 Tax=Halapricum desulfuricans TaxID=2841257 RepID=UPI0037423F37
MYCGSCGNELEEGTSYCPSCGHEIGTDPTESISNSVSRDISRNSSMSSVDNGTDYDIVMSIEDALRRRTRLRLILDLIALLVTAGFWAGWLIMEFIHHHYNIKKGETEPWEEGDEKSFNIL